MILKQIQKIKYFIQIINNHPVIIPFQRERQRDRERQRERQREKERERITRVCTVTSEPSQSSSRRVPPFNPNKGRLFEGRFFWVAGQFEPSFIFFIFQEKVFQYQYNFMQLLNNLFRKG